LSDLAPRRALVTGASRGIGRAIARRLAREGFHVAVHFGANAGAAAQTVAAIEAVGGHAFAVRQELGAPGDVDALFAQLGDDPLDVLVNNAGIAYEDGLEGVTPAAYEEQFAVNTRAALFATQAAARRMGEGGRIVTISSATTRRALPEWLVYTMTKAALDAMTRIVAQELAPRGITVNAVAAGVVDTDMNAETMVTDEHRAEAATIAALGRIGEPEDIADVVGFLVSDEARWVTGQVLDASGGSFL
jgi:NAD(P)-dependent dehydrogenase (short-subunit alcohol dehydrogenase family)